MKHRPLRISDHALIRYLERVKGVDVDALRAEMNDVLRPALDHPTARGIIIGSYCYKIENNTVLTVIRKNSPNPRTKRGRK